MNRNYTGLIERFVSAESCAMAADALHDIVDNTSPGNYNSALDELVSRMHAVAYSKIITRNSGGIAPYHIASALEANQLYLLMEVEASYATEPRWTLAKLDYLADKLAEASDEPISCLAHAHSILDYCFNTFRGLCGVADVMTVAYTSIDMDCAAQHIHHDKHPITLVNGAALHDACLVDSFAYEAVALLVAGSASAPSKSIIRELERTTVPHIKSLQQSKQYEAYLMSIKLGLAHNAAPFGGAIDRISNDPAHAQFWYDYIMHFGIA